MYILIRIFVIIVNGDDKMKKEITFKYATENDCEKILYFIKQLAIYEKLENEVVATEELLKETLFNQKQAEVLFILENNKEVGFSLFFHNYSTFLAKPGIHLEDLFVLKEYRGLGYGKLLIMKIKEIAINRKCGRLEWNCLKWNKPSIDFYLSLGAQSQEEWVGFRLDKEHLK